MSEEELDSIEILTNTDISTIELAENVDLITYSYAVKTVLNLIENLRIKNGKEFARGMETNEKLWQAKIKAKIKECEDRRFSDFTNECNFAVEKVLKELLGEQ